MSFPAFQPPGSGFGGLRHQLRIDHRVADIDVPDVTSHVHHALLLIADQVRAAGVFQAMRMRLLVRNLSDGTVLPHQLEDADSLDARPLPAWKQRTWPDPA